MQTQNEIDVLIDMMDELESQLFLEGKGECKVCGLLYEKDELKQGMCEDCINHEVYLEHGIKEPF